MQKALGSNPSGSMFLREFFCEAVVQSVARNMAICRYGNMRPPGIEPGAQAWEACMLPLHYERSLHMGRFIDALESKGSGWKE